MQTSRTAWQLRNKMEDNYKKLYESLSSEHIESWMTGDWLADKKRFIKEQWELNKLLIEDIDEEDDDY